MASTWPPKKGAAFNCSAFLYKTDGTLITNPGTLTCKISKDYGDFGDCHGTGPTEEDSTYGQIKIALDSTDMNADVVDIYLVDNTSGCIPFTTTLYTSAQTLDEVDSNVDAIKTKTDYLPSATAGSAGGVFIAGANAATTISTNSGSALTLISTDGNGLDLEGSGYGISAYGETAGALLSGLTDGGGLIVQAAGTGTAVSITGGDGSGAGISISTTDGDGIEITSGGAGHVDIDANLAGTITGNITGDITGNLSGSVGSVTGAVGSVTAEVSANVTKINSVATTSVTTVNAEIGTTQPVNFTGTGASAYVKSDTVDIAGSAVSTTTAQIGANVVQVSGDATAADNLEDVFEETAGVVANIVKAFDGSTGYGFTGCTMPTTTAVTNDVGITQAGADKVWGTAARTLTALDEDSTTLDLDATIESALAASATIAALPTASENADAVWDEGSSGHTDAGKAGAQLWTDVDAILADTNELQTNQGNWLTATGFSTHSASDVVTALGTGSTLTSLATAASIAALTEAGIKKNTELPGFTFMMVSSADHVTPATGLTVTAKRSIDGAAFASCANSVSELSNGFYKITLAASDLNGDIVTLKFTATGADTCGFTIKTSS